MSRRLTTLAALFLLLPGFAAFAGACGGDEDTHGSDGQTGVTAGGDAPAGSIRVDLVNWAVQPSRPSARAGSVTFWAVHDIAHAHDSDEGGVIHDLQVMKKSAGGNFELVGQVQGLKMGEAKALTLTLGRGEYELACSVVEQIKGQVIGHYPKGMHTPFEVTE